MAKKKTPADWKKEGEGLMEVFRASKMKAHNCAFLIANEGMAVATDKKLPPDRLWLQAKKMDGATAKGVKGTVTLNGIMVEITVDEAPPGNFELKLKQYFQQCGLKVKPVIIVPPGTAPAAEEGSDVETPVAEAPTGGGGAPPEQAAGSAPPEQSATAPAAGEAQVGGESAGEVGGPAGPKRDPAKTSKRMSRLNDLHKELASLLGEI